MTYNIGDGVFVVCTGSDLCTLSLISCATNSLTLLCV